MAQKSLTESQRAAKRTRDRNYRFRRMTRERQRVAIARDVLKLLDSQKLIAQRGTYIEVADVSAAAPKTRLKELVRMSNVSCEVCAIGSLFAAAVISRGLDGEQVAIHRVNSSCGNIKCCPPRIEFQSPSRRKMVKELKPFFTARELTRLEQYFENDTHTHWDEETDLSDDEALRSAMNHIIMTCGAEVCPTNVDAE